MPEHIFFTVLRGHPDEAELAAVTTVLMAVLRDRARPVSDAGTSAGARDAGAPGRASWGVARPRRRPAVSWSAP